MAQYSCVRCRNNKVNFKNRSFSWREITAWSMLDFSNSIALMVLLGQYTSFIAQSIYGLARYQEATDNVMYANIAVSVLMIVLSPPLGALIDSYYIRIPIVIISIVGYSVCSMVLYAVNEKTFVLPIVMYAIGVFFFRINEMVAGAFLPALCNDRDMGFVSSYGYFIGFLSGVIITLLLRLFTVLPKTIMQGTAEARAYTIQGYATAMMVCGIVQLLSGLPPMLMLDNGIPEGEKRPKWHASAIAESFRENARTIKNSFKINKTLTCILLDYILMSIAIQSHASFTGPVMIKYGGDYGFTLQDLQVCVIYYNAAVAVFSIVWAIVSRHFSSYWLVIIFITAIAVADTSGIWYRSLTQTESFNPGTFWIWFNFVILSIAFGPVQAIIRGTIGFLTPEEKKAEVFGCLESMILIGCLIGSTLPNLIYGKSYWAYPVWLLAFLVATLVVWIFIPVRKEEKKAWARIKAQEDAAIAAGVERNNSSENEEEGGEEQEEEEEEEDGDNNSSSSSSSESNSSSTSSGAPGSDDDDDDDDNDDGAGDNGGEEDQ